MRVAAAAAALTILLGGCGPQLADAGAAEPRPTPTATFTPRPGSYCAVHADDVQKCDPVFFTEMSPEYCAQHTTPPHCSTVMQCAVRPGPGEHAYPSAGILTGPPPANARPRITRHRAVRIARSTGGMLDRNNRPVTPEANLRTVTYGHFPGCRAKYRYGRKLAWVVTNHEAPPPVPAGPTPPGFKMDPRAKCDAIVFVDATSGKNLDWSYERTCPASPDGSVS